MTETGSIKPGKDFSTTVTASDPNDIAVTCGGEAVPFDFGTGTTPPGSYIIEVDGEDVTCPGPLVITENETQLACYTVAPC